MKLKFIKKSLKVLSVTALLAVATSCGSIQTLSGDQKEANAMHHYNQSKLNKHQLMHSLAMYQGAQVEGQDLSGQARLVAIETLKEIFEPKLDETKIDFTYGDYTKTFSLRELGYTYDYEKATTEAYALGRTGDEEERTQAIDELAKTPVNIAMPLVENQEVADATLKVIYDDLYIDAKGNGYSYDAENRKVIANEGEPGREVDHNQFKENIIAQGPKAGTVEIPITETSISKEAQAIADGVDGVIGSATTWYNNGFWARAENIRVSTQVMNGIVINPGETISMNDIIGDTTYDKGYQESVIIVGDKEVPGMGGGVCQTSTTLYMAALRADLTILHRVPHALPMPYADYGLDAAIEYGTDADLVLRNDFDFPVVLVAWADPGEVTFEILGDTTKKNYDVYIGSTYQYAIGYGTEYQYTSDLPTGETSVKTPGRTGYYYTAYRENASTGEVEYLLDSWYPAGNEVILKGE